MSEENKPYRVLARKYRPQNFGELIGQDSLVRTLKNAISSGRIAHAFMLTGVRGVGKTTTARIIAKALNYIGPEGTSGPTIEPTDDCSLCRAISEDRHPDVIEMDAASRTGVDNMREILDGVRYAPTEARYKIYIIDEVHMLSTAAFNALLKTLEEPPPHVKFIFATTEIRKVPITVLSRCQRFDLRRVGFDLLTAHFKKICQLENVKIDDEAVAMIARASDGSVRDGLSLLDQSIALGGEVVTGDLVQGMLGLADRMKNFDLLEKALTGDMPGALSVMDELHANGASPISILQDLLAITHVLTKLRAVPELSDMKDVLSDEHMRKARELSAKLSMPSLGKAWQILLKGISEINEAPQPQAAAEMVIIRLVYAADLPDPADLIKKLKSHTDASGVASGSSQNTTSGVSATLSTNVEKVLNNVDLLPTLVSLQDVINLLEANREVVLAGQLYQFAHLIKLEHINFGEQPSGKLEFNLKPEAPPRLANDLGKVLMRITGQRWFVTVSSSSGQPTLAEKDQALLHKEREEILNHPAIRDMLNVFPNLELVSVTNEQEKQIIQSLLLTTHNKESA